MPRYRAEILLTTRGKRNPRTFSSFQVWRESDGKLVKEQQTRPDPQGAWARVDARLAARKDAEAQGIEIGDGDIELDISEETVSTRARVY